MSGENVQDSIDLTSPESFTAGQEVYDRIESGQCQNVEAELDCALGITSEQN
ncbi:hypothetical protein SAMN05428944_7398 [Streptomyces sp. 1222.5]|uniref:hypothetical protein n=1 Tax=unclassified Streptomyces TaxID=2593676 RepID=UPI00089B3FAE|nr:MULTISPECIES: hypothetical protein [unclassified Streptomyces]PKW05576.1 hypothetical protein BX260_0693 [Streptomyces sp. 5112.2]SED35151.1 hypothetical protein SAMN05428944_7398 [Streptomyces sp. 1222.5]